MPWSFERKVIYPAGWCRGPSSYGNQMNLDERVWQAYQSVDGRIHLRRAKGDLSGWEWEEEIVLPAHESATYPDVCFDKAGEPFVAFESEGGVWIRRISVVEGTRTEIIEKLVDGAYGPKCFRDPDNDLLVFYVDAGTTEIRYRVQAEGWATERAVGMVAEGHKRIQSISLATSYWNSYRAPKLLIGYSLEGNQATSKLQWVLSSPYGPEPLKSYMQAAIIFAGSQCLPIYELGIEPNWLRLSAGIKGVDMAYLLPNVLSPSENKAKLISLSTGLLNVVVECVLKSLLVPSAFEATAMQVSIKPNMWLENIPVLNTHLYWPSSNIKSSIGLADIIIDNLEA